MQTFFTPIDLSLMKIKYSKNRHNSDSVLIGQIIQDEYLSFNGIRRPLEISFVKEAGPVSYSHSQNKEGNIKSIKKDEIFSIKDIGKDSRDLILSQYFTDVYMLFLNKLTSLVTANKLTEAESTKLQSLLDEMIKVKSLLSKE